MCSETCISKVGLKGSLKLFQSTELSGVLKTFGEMLVSGLEPEYFCCCSPHIFLQHTSLHCAHCQSYTFRMSTLRSHIRENTNKRKSGLLLSVKTGRNHSNYPHRALLYNSEEPVIRKFKSILGAFFVPKIFLDELMHKADR